MRRRLCASSDYLPRIRRLLQRAVHLCLHAPTHAPKAQVWSALHSSHDTVCSLQELETASPAAACDGVEKKGFDSTLLELVCAPPVVVPAPELGDA